MTQGIIVESRLWRIIIKWWKSIWSPEDLQNLETLISCSSNLRNLFKSVLCNTFKITTTVFLLTIQLKAQVLSGSVDFSLYIILCGCSYQLHENNHSLPFCKEYFWPFSFYITYLCSPTPQFCPIPMTKETSLSHRRQQLDVSFFKLQLCLYVYSLDVSSSRVPPYCLV